ANICMRMVIITTAIVQECVAGVNKRNSRQRANCSALQEFGKQTNRKCIFETPDRGKRQIAEEITMAHSGGGQTIEDSGKSGDGDAVTEPICLPCPQKDTIRKTGTKDRREVSIADHVVPRKRTVKRKVRLGVVSDRVRVISART